MARLVACLDLEPALGAVRLQRLTGAHVEDFRDDMLSRSAPASVKYALGLLSKSMGKAASRGLIARNPVGGVARPKGQGQKMRLRTAEQAARLIDVVRGTRDEALNTAAPKLGLRQGELLALFWEDLEG